MRKPDIYEGPPPTLKADSDLVNADWTKQTFDITGVNSVEELKTRLAQLGISVARFKKLPVYAANVKKIPWLRRL